MDGTVLSTRIDSPPTRRKRRAHSPARRAITLAASHLPLASFSAPLLFSPCVVANPIPAPGVGSDVDADEEDDEEQEGLNNPATNSAVHGTSPEWHSGNSLPSPSLFINSREV
ncbi:hypothetical protein MSAN_00170100 [Mycena sanguinolenta]|uniref:Uncharacterized protein n=1 Tax=Mycena sanguinolenta TaxID=230812 RepID=A0A8H6ZJF6_9AGAR|nr:hypothetical protein MSAN_00170100 [Mycena sanguinolenta]